MDRHPIPRQVTTFQFKLIGFLTIKQFAYLLATTAITISVYFLIPVPLINIILAGLVGAAGAAFSLLTYNDRSFDIWIKNLAVAIISPSQYHYIKRNLAPTFLQGVYLSTPALVGAHVDANQKLASYIGANTDAPSDQEARRLDTLFSQPDVPTPKEAPPASTDQPTPPVKTPTNIPEAFISGIVQGNDGKALAGIMVYIKSETGMVVRILKTNTHGVFASFHRLIDGKYTIEPKDLSSRNFFDTMTVDVSGKKSKPLYINAKRQS